MYCVYSDNSIMNDLIPQCARWLENNKDPVHVLEVLRTLHPGSLNKNVRRVRREWMQVYGPGQNDGAIRKDLKRILKVLQRKASSLAKKTSSDSRKKYSLKQLKIAESRIISFFKLDLFGKWAARNTIHSHKESFTGLVDIDALVRKVNILPPHVSQLELTPEEKSIPRKRRREALAAKCEKSITVNASDLVDLMGAIITYPRANYFELACALSFVSGRALPELVRSVVQFSPSSHGNHEVHIKVGGGTYRIPLICEYEHFIGGVNRLRGMKDTSRLTPAEVNHRFSKSVNLYARKLLPEEAGLRVFSDLKTLHVVISHRKFTGHEFDLGEWLKIARGGPSSPALHRKCSVVKVEGIKEEDHRHWTF